MMGDRANFGIKMDESNTLFVYGHYAGHEMMNRFSTALLRVRNADRLQDPEYATRIVISSLVGEDHSGDYGWGISLNYLVDNEHSFPVVDFSEGTVSLYEANEPIGGKPKFVMTIDKFILKFVKDKSVLNLITV